MNIKDRIYELIAALKTKPATFEKALGLSNSYLRNVQSVAADTCRRVVEVYPNVSLQWLICGTGDMFVDSANTSPTQTNQGITNDIHGDGSIEVLNVGEGASVDSSKEVNPSSSHYNRYNKPDFEEMAFDLNCEVVDLKDEIKQKDSKIRELEARLEERERTIEILTKVLDSNK